MKKTRIILYTALAFCLIIISRCSKNPAYTASTEPENTPPVLMVPYISESDVTYIQPFGVPLDFGGGDIRPHEAVDFGCNDGVEFVASASGTLGNIWLNYPHSYQFNIVIDDKHVVHFSKSSQALMRDMTTYVQITPITQIQGNNLILR